MDYYYALLENYEQLKRRKFKLSLREEEEAEGDDKAKDAARQAADAAFGAAKDITPEERKTLANGDELVFVKSGPDGGLTSALGGPFKSAAMKGVKSLDDLDDKVLAKVIGYFMDHSEGEAEEGGDEGEAFKPEEELLQTGVELDNLLNGTEETEGLLATNEDGEPEAEQPYFPGYQPTKSKSRLAKITTIIRKKAKGEEQGLGYRGEVDATIEEKILASPEVDQAKALEAAKAYKETTEVVIKLRGWDGKPPLPQGVNPEVLQSLSTQTKLTPNGVMFNGIYMNYRSKANDTNDIPTNMVGQINKAIAANNLNYKDMDKDSEAYKAGHVKPIKPPEREGTDINFARRGTLMEHVSVLGDLGAMADVANCGSEGGAAQADCGEASKLADEKIGEILADTTTLDQAKEMFKRGLCAAGQQCIVDMDGVSDAQMIEAAHTYLVDHEGWTDEQAAFVMERVAESDDGSRALLILVASTRQYQEVYKGLELRGASVEGAVGADLPGQKTDVLKVTQGGESLDAWIAERQENMSPEEAELEERSECTGEAMGWGALPKKRSGATEESRISEAKRKKKKSFKSEEDSEYDIPIEIKTRTDINSGRTKMGEGKSSAMKDACSYDSAEEKAKDDELAAGAEMGDEDAAKQLERRKMEKEFLQRNEDRLNNCAGAHAEKLGESPWGGNDDGSPKTMRQAACEVQDSIDKALSTPFAVLDGTTITDQSSPEDKVNNQHAGDALINDWQRGRDKPSENAARAKLAKGAISALNATPPRKPSAPEQTALDKIKEDLELAEMGRQLATDRYDSSDRPDPSKPIGGKAKAYLLYRLSREGGSLDECGKDVRGLGTEVAEAGESGEKVGGVNQRLGCINSGVYGMISGVMSGDYDLVGGMRGGQLTTGYSIRSKADKESQKKAGTLGGIKFERPGTGKGVTSVATVNMGSLSSPDQALSKRKEAEEATSTDEKLMLFLRGQAALLEKLIDQTT